MAPIREFTTRKIDVVAEEVQASCSAAISCFKAVSTTFQNTSKFVTNFFLNVSSEIFLTNVSKLLMKVLELTRTKGFITW